MLSYKAMYKFVEGGVHAEVMDFPGVITFGSDLAEARRLLAGALADMAETCVLEGEPVPMPNPAVSDPEADFVEALSCAFLARTLRAGRGGG